MPERINEDAIAARRQQLFGDPWWRQRERPAATQRMCGTQTDHCEICPAAADERCLKWCMEARKELADGIEVTFP